MTTNKKNNRTAQTREGTRQLGGHYPAEFVTAFKTLAASQDMDVQELMAVGINMAFEKHGVPNRINTVSGRRKKQRTPGPVPAPVG